MTTKIDPKVIVALDFAELDATLAFIDELDPSHCRVKVGKELFTRFGAGIVKRLVDKKFDVFLDLKYHDIPNTVASACLAAADLGVWMVNMHAMGGVPMMTHAAETIAKHDGHKPLLIAVTILTSMSMEDIMTIGLTGPVEYNVKHLAELAEQSGMDGVVCSAHEVELIHSVCSSKFLTVTPGIRLESDDHNDQKRVMTPKAAVAAGADYLVIGRPITQAENPSAILQKINVDINQ
ncbi:MAG: orotidine-5'-phosphate decarboxylase [Legionellales bacterium]|nr:orotidine-5'-phosphate decarboxylase [Legionellales bacterium]|tara:strand:- start:4885 stop:5592 length:708 start_codon:yes stop_codon:yes gene_type:complete